MSCSDPLSPLRNRELYAGVASPRDIHVREVASGAYAWYWEETQRGYAPRESAYAALSSTPNARQAAWHRTRESAAQIAVFRLEATRDQR